MPRTEPPERCGPRVHHGGGPAGRGVRPGPALRGYRLVMFDQRGTGAGALNCPALQQEMGASDLTVPAAAAVRSCAAAIGPSRRYFATADTVAEIESALSRLAAVRFGWCEQCGGVITAARLTEMPQARYCPECVR